MTGGSHAVVARLRSELLSFTAAFSEALGELHEFMEPADATRLHLERARRLLAEGDRVGATDVLIAAHSNATTHGLDDLAAEAEALARRSQLQLVAGETVLTARELEVLRLLSLGRTNPEIAQELHVSRSTARAHVSSILDKPGATSRTEAVSIAHRRGIV
jgi:DNA-binding NarL/FixJ family response regulator